MKNSGIILSVLIMFTLCFSSCGVDSEAHLKNSNDSCCAKKTEKKCCDENVDSLKTDCSIDSSASGLIKDDCIKKVRTDSICKIKDSECRSKCAAAKVDSTQLRGCIDDCVNSCSFEKGIKDSTTVSQKSCCKKD